MTKKELTKKIVDRIADKVFDEMSMNDLVTLFIEGFTEEVIDTVSKGEGVYLRGFGCFEQKTRQAKKGQNITKGETIDIPEKVICKFKPYFKID